MEQYSKRSVMLLRRLSSDSRTSISDIAKELKCSRATVTKMMEMLEEKLGIKYTLEVNEYALKDAQRHLITISFTKKPTAEFLKEFFDHERFVQEVYMTEGAFDLMIYTRTSDPITYITWETYLASALADYGALLKPCEIVETQFGFFPLDDSFVDEIGGKVKVDAVDKKLLVLLNQNSRMSVAEMSRRVKLRDSTIRYRIFRMKREGLIRRFTLIIQRPPQEYPMVYLNTYRFNRGIADRFLRLITFWMEQDTELTLLNPFQIIAPVSGSYRSFAFTIFENKEEMEEKVIHFQTRLFKADEIKINNAKITGVLKGFYPFRSQVMRDHYHRIAWKG